MTERCRFAARRAGSLVGLCSLLLWTAAALPYCDFAGSEPSDLRPPTGPIVLFPGDTLEVFPEHFSVGKRPWPAGAALAFCEPSPLKFVAARFVHPAPRRFFLVAAEDAAPGRYSVDMQVRRRAGGTHYRGPRNIKVLDPSFAVIARADPPEIEPGQSSQLSATIVGGIGNPFIIRWTPVASLSDTASANTVATPQETTTYSVWVFDNTLAEAITATVTVTVRPPGGLVAYFTASEGPSFQVTPDASDSEGPIRFYRWWADWDGTPPMQPLSDSSSNPDNVTLFYTTPGLKTIRLVVVDGTGMQSAPAYRTVDIGATRTPVASAGRMVQR